MEGVITACRKGLFGTKGNLRDASGKPWAFGRRTKLEGGPFPAGQAVEFALSEEDGTIVWIRALDALHTLRTADEAVPVPVTEVPAAPENDSEGEAAKAPETGAAVPESDAPAEEIPEQAQEQSPEEEGMSDVETPGPDGMEPAGTEPAEAESPEAEETEAETEISPAEADGKGVPGERQVQHLLRLLREQPYLTYPSLNEFLGAEGLRQLMPEEDPDLFLARYFEGVLIRKPADTEEGFAFFPSAFLTDPIPDDVKDAVERQLRMALRERKYVDAKVFFGFLREQGISSYKDYSPTVESFLGHWYYGDYACVRNAVISREKHPLVIVRTENRRMIAGGKYYEPKRAENREGPAPAKKEAEPVPTVLVPETVEERQKSSADVRIEELFAKGRYHELSQMGSALLSSPSELSDRSTAMLVLALVRAEDFEA